MYPTQEQLPPSSSPTKRQLIMISSFNKRCLQDKKASNYRTIDYSRHGLPPAELLNTSAVQQQTNIVNVQLDEQLMSELVSVSQSPSKNRRKPHFVNDSLKKFAMITSNRTKTANRYPEGFKEIYLKKSNQKGLQVIAKYKYPVNDDHLPMKKYMKIEKIQLPKPDPVLKPATSKGKKLGFSSDSIKRTLNQYDSYLEKVTALPKSTKQKSSNHRRNYSSANSVKHGMKMQDLQKRDLQIKVGGDQQRWAVEDIIIRRPMMRKDYFVFGMGDRTNPENKIQYFRDMLWKVNFSNGLYVETPETINNNYKAYIGPGNNYYLVKGVLKRRFWWTIVEKSDGVSANLEEFNFVWTQLKQNCYFKQQKDCDKVRAIEEDSSDSKEDPQKASSSKQDEQAIEDQVLSPKETRQKVKPQQALSSRIKLSTKKDLTSPTEQPVPESDGHKKIFSRSDLQKWQTHYDRNLKTEDKINEHTYSRRMNLFAKKQIKYIQNSNRLRTHNHLENNFFIGNKKALFYNLRKYLTLKDVDPFTFIPMTFHIRKGVEDPEYKIFKQYYQQIQKEKPNNGLRNMWIIKPGENTNRGNGITVSYSIDDVNMRLKSRERNSDGKLRTFIVQKYLERPLLYNRRKFDIRHYMLVTCINGGIKGYWYEDGYIRTSSLEYTMKYCKDPLVHLTNDAIQKNCPTYGKYQKGNKLSYADFQRYLETSGNSEKKGKKINFFQNILPEMKDIATDALKACYALLDPNRKQNNFELLGLDFMLDQDLKPWLIEVNTNPCLELSCSILEKIIPQLIDNVFKICVDPLFPPPENWMAGRKFYFGDNPLGQNKFQIVFDERDDGRELQKLYKGSEGVVDQRLGKVEEDDQTFQDNGDQNWQANKKV